MKGCGHFMFVKVVLLISCTVLAPLAASAGYYAQAVGNYSQVDNPDSALLGPDLTRYALLAPGGYIELDMGLRFGDACFNRDICIYTVSIYSNNIKVQLADTNGTWENADFSWTSPNGFADMRGPACANIFKRWQWIRIINLNKAGGDSVGIDAVQSLVGPGFEERIEQAALLDPDPSDLCDCGGATTHAAPGLSLYGRAGLIGLLLVGGVVLLIARTRRAAA